MPSKVTTLRVLSVMCVLNLVSAVSAHDPPAISHMVWNSQHEKLVLGTNRGLIFGEPKTHSWRMLCGTALGIPLNEEPDLVYLHDGRLLAGTTKGLKATSDEGCSWSVIEPLHTPVSALTQHPTDANKLYAAVWDAQQGGLYESQDGAATWTKRLNIGPNDYIAQVKLAPSQPSRIYLGGLVYDDRAKVFSFQVTRSDDGGATWMRLYIPLLAEEEQAEVLAVSPVDPQTLLVLAENQDRGLGEDRVLISRDGGASFTTLVHAVYLHAASFSPDGKTAFIAGDAALYRSDMALQSAAPFGAAQLMSCVTVDGQAVYACGNPSGFDPVNAGVGVSMDQAMTFTKLMAFTEVKQTVMCPAASETARVCQDLWTDWQLEILVGVGGAPMDSVAGWMSFTPPDPAATMGPPKPNLTTAKASPGAPSTSASQAIAGSGAAPAALSGTAPAAASGGCTIAPQHTYAPWWLALGVLLLRRRTFLRSAARFR